MIAVRRGYRAFGRGTLRFLYPANRKVLTYLREFEDERILCVVNISRAPQAVELDLSEFKGATPVELTAGSVFPPVGTLPYLLTLPAYGFYWFKLEPATAEPLRYGPTPTPELFTLVFTEKLESFLTGRELVAFESTVAPKFLAARRWYAAKGARIKETKVRDFTILRDGVEGRFVLLLLDVDLAGDGRQTYFTPLAAEEDGDNEHKLAYAISRLRRGPRTGILYDADASPAFGVSMLAAIRDGTILKTNRGGKIVFSPSPAFADKEPVSASEVQRMGVEQSNSSLNLGNRYALKIYRRLQEGENPEIDIGRFLTEVAGFNNTPPLFGTVEHVDAEGHSTALAVLQGFVRGQGDAWRWTLDALKRLLEDLSLAPAEAEAVVPDSFSSYVPHMQRLGLRTAELHKALATPTDDMAFAAEPLTHADLLELADDTQAYAERAFGHLTRLGERASEQARVLAERLLARRKECFALIEALAVEPIGAVKTRVHGDYHLGQVLVVKDDVIIIDFEGEPSRSLAQRRAKSSPLRDVASMLRSFAYAVATAKRDLALRLPEMSASQLQDKLAQFSHIFVETYMEAARGSRIWIDDQPTRQRLLLFYLLSKALYEIDYEASNRPDWIDIPIEGVHVILDLAKEVI
jgi:maltose alpha-D-glucosyltransferase/alpha-amylase